MQSRCQDPSPVFPAAGVRSLRPLFQGALALALFLAAVPARAQADLGQVTQRWLDDALQRNLAGQGPLRMEVAVGALDDRLRLAPCARVEPYLPAGARLWGRTRLGLRCMEGPTRWNVYLPVTVKAFGPAWVLAADIPAGAALAASDATEVEVDWAAENSPVLAEPSLWVGQVASRHLKAGQALRQAMLRAPQLFPAGAQVRVVAQGQGYAISAAGQAMAPGAVGQNVRVRMDNGKIVTGIVNVDGTISINL